MRVTDYNKCNDYLKWFTRYRGIQINVNLGSAGVQLTVKILWQYTTEVQITVGLIFPSHCIRRHVNEQSISL